VSCPQEGRSGAGLNPALLPDFLSPRAFSHPQL
jgi:hypothetical protein